MIECIYDRSGKISQGLSGLSGGGKKPLAEDARELWALPEIFLENQKIRSIKDITEDAVRDFRVNLSRKDLKKIPRVIT